MPISWIPILGSGLLGYATEAVVALAQAVLGSILLLGNIYFDTALIANPAIYVDTTAMITASGSDFLTLAATETQLSGTLALTEVDTTKGGSGTQVITNPNDFYLICDDVIFNVDTAPAPATSADIYFSTGSTVAVTGTGADIYDNYDFRAGLITMTGSALVNSLTTGGRFILAPSDSTTENKSIVIVSRNGTGAGLAGQYKIPCEYLKP